LYHLEKTRPSAYFPERAYLNRIMMNTDKSSLPHPGGTASATPPTLAKKLGIAPDTKIRVIGSVDDEALRSALAEGQVAARGKAGAIIACVNTRTELEDAFERSIKLVLDGASLWIVYRKGKGHPINQTDVRDTGLAAGIVDVKVAAVSDQLTGLKFVRRKVSTKK
jgi:hypothetical protein